MSTICFRINVININYKKYTVLLGFSMALTKSQEAMVQGRTVSVLPSRNRRVMLDSYVRLNLPAVCNVY